MNETIKTIKARRSVRRFMPEQLNNQELEQIIEAGLYAPSGHNQQSWNFTVIQNKEMILEINNVAKDAAKNFPDEMIQKMANNDSLDVFYGAPTVVIVSGNNNTMTPQADCGAATQNMLLAAESLGVGSCWNGFVGFLFSGEKGQAYIEKLGIPSGYSPYYAVALGYKGSNPTQAPARKENAVKYIK